MITEYVFEITEENIDTLLKNIYVLSSFFLDFTEFASSCAYDKENNIAKFKHALNVLDLDRKNQDLIANIDKRLLAISKITGYSLLSKTSYYKANFTHYDNRLTLFCYKSTV